MMLPLHRGYGPVLPEETRKPVGAREPIIQAARDYRDPAVFPPLFYLAEQERLQKCHAELASLEAQAEAFRIKRDAALRRLVAMGGAPRPAPTPGRVIFPVFGKRAAP